MGDCQHLTFLMIRQKRAILWAINISEGVHEPLFAGRAQLHHPNISCLAQSEEIFIGNQDLMIAGYFIYFCQGFNLLDFAHIVNHESLSLASIEPLFGPIEPYCPGFTELLWGDFHCELFAEGVHKKFFPCGEVDISCF